MESSYTEILKQFPQQIEYAATLGKDITFQKEFDNICFVGMGGSGIVGDIVQLFVQDKPCHTIRSFEVPKYITNKSLVFIISYSGETEETIDAFRKLVRRNASVVCISSQGKLEKLAPMYKCPYIKIPNGLQPRQAIGYMTLPIMNVLAQCGYIKFEKEDILTISQTIKKDVYEQNASSLMEKIGNKTPIIYASHNLYPIAYAWKTNFNENAKTAAFCGEIPEIFHNEICQYPNDSFYTIILKDTDDDRRIKDQMTKLKDLIKEKEGQVIELVIKGEHKIAKVFSALYLGQWLSVLYAQNKDIDPTPIQTIEQFKKK